MLKMFKNRMIITGPTEDVAGLFNLANSIPPRKDEVFSLTCVLPIPLPVQADFNTRHAIVNKCEVTGDNKFSSYSDSQLWCSRIWGTPEDIKKTSYKKMDDGIMILDFISEKSPPFGWVNYLSENVPTYKIVLLHQHHPTLEYGYYIYDESQFVAEDNFSDEKLWLTSDSGMPLFNWDKLTSMADEASGEQPLIFTPAAFG